MLNKDHLLQGVQSCNTAGPSANNQIGPWAVAACIKLCGLFNSIATHVRLEYPFKT